MIGEIKNTMRTKMGKAYLYICLWGNKKKLEEEKKKREIEDQNDILKEEFERQLEEIHDLVFKGKLVLNKVNIEKSKLYLASKNYLNAVKEAKKLTDHDIKSLKMKNRINQRNFMNRNLNNYINDSGSEKDVSEISKNDKSQLDLLYDATRMEKSVNDFLQIPDIEENQKASEEVSERTIDVKDLDQNLFLGVNKINRNYEIPKLNNKNSSPFSTKKLDLFTNPQYDNSTEYEIFSPNYDSNGKNSKRTNNIKILEEEKSISDIKNRSDQSDIDFTNLLNTKPHRNSSNIFVGKFSKTKLPPLFNSSKNIKDDSDDEEDENRKEEFLQQEKLFKKRQKVMKKQPQVLLNQNDGFKRVERVQHAKQKRKEELKNKELTIEFDHELHPESKETMIEQLNTENIIDEAEKEVAKGKQKISINTIEENFDENFDENDDDLDFSQDERVGF